MQALIPETGGIAQLITNAVTIFVVIHVILGACAYAIMLERKLSAWMQDRIGPNRVGPKGLLQPIADGLKFLFKEDYRPKNTDGALFTLAPALIIIPAIIGFVIIPWAGVLDFSQLPFGLASKLGLEGVQVKITGAAVNIGVIYLVAVASLGVYGVGLGGWASGSKFSFLGGLRASAQMISYEIPMGVSLLCVVLLAGSLDPYAIVLAQQDGMWNLLQQPLAAIIFYTCLLAESNRAPFDLAEAESELVGGYHTEYSSMRFAMFFLAEYFHMITGSALFCVLFLGGFSLNPFGAGPDLPLVGGPLLILAQFGILAGKIFLVVSLGMAIRWTVPRFRYDQLMRLAWEGMIPASVLVLAATALMVYWGRTDLMWLASIACVVVIYAVRPLLPKQPNANQRIRIIGSRFSPVTEGEAAPRHPLALNESAVPDPAQGPISMH